MSLKDRQKMCVSCNGRIPFDAEECPYCAAGQETAPIVRNTKEQHHQSLQESLTSLYTPSYSGKSSSLLSQISGKKESPHKTEPLKEIMAEKRFIQSAPSLGSPTIPVDTNEQPTDEGKSVFWPILFLSVAANLLTLGILQLFFSDHGVLSLEWDSSYWFIYCLVALPLFFLGFKKANVLK